MLHDGHAFAAPRRDAPGFCIWFRPRKTRAQGRPGARCTRGLMCKLCEMGAHEHTGPAESIRPSLRNGFTAYTVISPATNSLLSPSLANVVCLSPVGPTHLRQLGISNGCRNHTVLPYAATRLAKRLRRGWPVFAKRINRAKAPFVCVLSIAHEQARPAITFHARRRRVHRNPSRVRDAGQRPL